MTASDTVAYTSCPGCHHRNSPSHLYCNYCGQPLPSAKLKGNACYRCGRFDELSVRYCIYCGADTRKQPTSSEEVRRFSWELSQPQVLTTGRALATVRKSRSSPLSLLVAIALGSAVGLLFANVLTPVLERIYVEGMWTKQSQQPLVIYSKQKYADVTISSMQEPKFWVGKTGASGTLLQPGLGLGHYTVTLSAPSHQRCLFGAIAPLEIKAGHPTVIGYKDGKDGKIDLPPIHRGSDPSTFDTATSNP